MNAIILAAGLSIRLRSLTHDLPKCLVEINRRSILESALANLEKNGIEETVIVVGYLKDVIINRIGSRFDQMKITYIENKIYDKTNSMYSLWLARKHLDKGAIWMNSDIFFEESVLKRLLDFDKAEACWAADKFTEEMDGAMLTIEGTERIINIEIVREKLNEYKNIFFKSAGILKVSSEFGSIISQWLDDDVKIGEVNTYFDLVLAKHINEYPIYICNIKGLKWYEIDTPEDLTKAQLLFEN